MTVADRDSMEQLQQLLARSRDRRLRQRLRMVLGAKEGKTHTRIAGEQRRSKRSVQGWIRRYNQLGIEGLKDRPGRGDKPTLGQDQQKLLQARLDAGPLPGDGVSVFRGPDVKRIIESELNVLMPLRTVQHALHRMGYRYLSPRPRHVKADPRQQAEFKKNSRANWPSCSVSTPASG